MPTHIEWADETWNPITGCDPISEGCANCYAERMARRLAGRFGYLPAPHHFRVTVHPDKMDQPLRRKKPRRIFPCSMSDMFHPDVPEDILGYLWWVMRKAHQHTYLILTKRPERMREFIAYGLEMGTNDFRILYPHVLLGVTAENQKRADERIPILLSIPAAGHFVSLEPMLGAVNLWGYFPRYDYRPTYEYYRIWAHSQGWDCGDQPIKERNGLDWVIAGGESGPGARPTHPQWVRDVRDQCQESGTPFLFKQWGRWMPVEQSGLSCAEKVATLGTEYEWPDGVVSIPVGKRAAGRLLDGREWDEYPEGIK